MKDFAKVTVAGPGEVDKLVDEGWEFIETVKSSDGYNDQKVVYHMGLPQSVRVEQLLSIIREYEERGFKNEMFKQVAEENDDDVENYTLGGGVTTNTPTTKFMNNYIKVVDDTYSTYQLRFEKSNLKF